MGREVPPITVSQQDRRRYRKKMHSCLDVLAQMLREYRFDTGHEQMGLEIEFNLVDDTGAPSMKSTEALKAIDDPGWASELGQFNLEINVPPGPLSGDALAQLEKHIQESVNRADHRARRVGCRMAMIGILPTLGEIHVRGPNVFLGYWHNDAATAEVLDPEGWFGTGDVGGLDEEGFLQVTGRKKELIVTAGGKNVAPAVLEDRLRASPLISQCVVVGDGRPYIACLITLDEEGLEFWRKQHGLAADADVTDNPELTVDIQAAVDEANKAVSRAESIRRFRVLPSDFTEENGYLTPSLKVRRNLVIKDFAADIEALYNRP